MRRDLLQILVAVIAGASTVATLDATVGHVPPWLAFICGVIVVLARMSRRDDGENGDKSERTGRHRRPDSDHHS